MAPSLWPVRVFENLFGGRTIPRPRGLAYSPRANRFLTITDSQTDGTVIVPLTPLEDLVPERSAKIRAKPENLINTAFDSKYNRLLLLANSKQLIAVSTDSSGNLIAGSETTFNLQQFGIRNAQGITVDPTTGALFVLDRAAKQIVKLVPDANGSFDRTPTSVIDLGFLGRADLQSIALDPTTGNLHILSPGQQNLYEVSQNGSLLNTRSTRGLGLRNPQSITFAPTGDSTDDANAVSLYIADSAAGSGGVVELSLSEPTLATAVTSLTYIQTIDTSTFSPASPDPSGLTYIPATNSLLISDGEVEEMAIFQGKNLFNTTLTGTLTQTGFTRAGSNTYSNEPTDIVFDPNTGNVFITDDDLRQVFEINPGSDGLYGTTDDSIVQQFSTQAFGSGDPEGITYDPVSQSLFIADGVNSEVYRITRTGNLISHFDTAGLGILDPEGIAYNPVTGNLFLIGNPANVLAEFTTSGTLVNTFSISAANPLKPAGLAIAPTSNNPSGTSIYISDRRVDNLNNPNENDGKIYEFALNEGTPPPVDNTKFYLSANEGGNIAAGVNGGTAISFGDEDILLYNFANPISPWSLYFDGSDVGLSGQGVDVNDFELQADGSILMAFDVAVNIASGLSASGQSLAITPSDIVRFIPTQTGATTAGKYELYFQGADVGLSDSAETIDAIDVQDDGSIVISTSGDFTVNGGVTGNDEDLLLFTPTSLGANTAGTWSFFIDGSDVGLNNSSTEDVNGAWIDLSVSPNQFYFTLLGTHTVPGTSGNISGDGNDILKFTPSSIGSNTSGTFEHIWNGNEKGFGGVLDGIYLDFA